MDLVSFCNISVIQQDTQCFMIELIHNTWWLDMFRASIVHLQEGSYAVCCNWYVSIRPVVMRVKEELQFFRRVLMLYVVIGMSRYVLLL